MKMHVVVGAVFSILFFSADAKAEDQADAEWTKHANNACTKAAGGKTATVVPDWSVINVEKCGGVECKASDGRKFQVNLPNGAPCIKYMIVTPPPRPVRGTCSNSQCRT